MNARYPYLRTQLKHPAWWPRIIRNTFRTRTLWLLQGCPRDEPVIIKAGRLECDEYGRGTISGFHFDGRLQHRSIALDEWWDRLSARYPVERPYRDQTAHQDAS